MKNSILLVSFSFLFCACQTYQRPEPDAITVAVRGTPGLKFSGTYSIDGKEQQVCGAVPMDLEIADGNFCSEFRKDGDGVLTVIVNKGCKPYGEASSLTAHGGVRTAISPGEVFDLTYTTGF